MSFGKLTVRTPQNELAFIDGLANSLSVTGAAKNAGLCVRTLYQWREKDAAFAKRWADSVEAGTDTLEDIATERAKDKSDLLMIFLMKARRPEKYRDNHPEEKKPDVDSDLADLANKLAGIIGSLAVGNDPGNSGAHGNDSVGAEPGEGRQAEPASPGVDERG